MFIGGAPVESEQRFARPPTRYKQECEQTNRPTKRAMISVDTRREWRICERN